MDPHSYVPLLLILILILILQSQTCLSLSWPSWGRIMFSGQTQNTEKPFDNWAIRGDFSADFSLKSVDYTEGIQLVENAKRKLVSSNSCWQRAYQQIFEREKSMADSNFSKLQLEFEEDSTT